MNRAEAISKLETALPNHDWVKAVNQDAWRKGRGRLRFLAHAVSVDVLGPVSEEWLNIGVYFYTTIKEFPDCFVMGSMKFMKVKNEVAS